MNMSIKKEGDLYFIGHLKYCNGGSCLEAYFNSRGDMEEFFKLPDNLEVLIEEGVGLNIRTKGDFMKGLDTNIVALYPNPDSKSKQIMGIKSKEGIIEV